MALYVVELPLFNVVYRWFAEFKRSRKQVNDDRRKDRAQELLRHP